MRASTLAKKVQADGQRLLREIERAEQKTAKFAHRLVVRYSSGNVPMAVLSRPVFSGGLGHPYGHGPIGSTGPRGAVPYGDPAVINAQTGAFKAGWEVELGQWQNGRLTQTLRNNVPHADYLEFGTKWMTRRPILDRVHAAVLPVRITNLLEAIRRAQRP